MKLIKKILLVIVIIIAVPFVIALFVKKDYSVERQVTINKPRNEVFNYIKLVKNQDQYSKWAMMDPEMKKEYSGTDGTVGFVYAWDGEKAGKGEQVIKKITDEERLDLALHFIKPFEGTATAWMVTKPASTNQTTVAWGMKGESKYPMNFMNLFMDSMLGKDLETSLTKLKSNLEN
ncbi:MAG TPA: SRPBCC family protein [Sphingobacteriaceae bacterium]